MLEGWQASLLVGIRTISQILTAGIAVTAFSLLLYALAFNLRDRVARTFATIMFFVVIVYTAEAIGSNETSFLVIDFFLRLQWVGITFLPAAYLHFSDALLATTGKPSRGRRRWAVRFTYLGSVIFLMGLPFDYLIGPTVYNQPPAPYLKPTLFTDLFLVFYIGMMVLSWYNFIRAFRRTTTATSRRRMTYLVTGALAPALGGLPFLPYGPEFAARHSLTFWSVSLLANIGVGVLMVVMAYSVAFFGVSWPDRVVKSRLFKWIMRGPFTASLTLAAVTLTRRAGEAVGSSYTALVPIVMVACILLSEYLITLFSPLAERWLFYGKDKAELNQLRNLEDRLLTRNDLKQFLEMILSATCDRLQAGGAYVAAISSGGLELVVSTGKTRFWKLADQSEWVDRAQRSGQEDQTGREDDLSTSSLSDELLDQISEDGVRAGVFHWGEDYLFPLLNGTPEKPELLGLLGVSNVAREALDEEQLQSMKVLVQRAALALQDRRVQQKVFQSLESLTPQMDLIQRLRAAGRFDQSAVLTAEENLPPESDVPNMVKDALTHYWGGPKFTQNPLMRFKVVQDAAAIHEGNSAIALRAILKRAIEQVRPEGERRFTGEWILYNILEMKFLEGRKVREVAVRLAVSEADLYRKQRIAVEAVAKAISDMEIEARKGVGE
jgi:hypothetical protein